MSRRRPQPDGDLVRPLDLAAMFTVDAAAPLDLVVHVFNYPAWNVVVNGRPIETSSTEPTGLMVIPIAAGDSDVRIDFRRTVDRLAGDIVSLLSMAVLVAAWVMTRRRYARASIESTAA